MLLAALVHSPFIVAENEPTTKIRNTSSNPDADQKAWYAWSLAQQHPKALRLTKLSIRSIFDHEFFRARLAEEKDAMFFYLERENPAHVILSAIKAEHYAKAHQAQYGNLTWGVRPGREIELATPIDVDQFMDQLEKVEADKALFDSYRKATGGMSFYYSEIQSDVGNVVERVCDRLGVPVPRFELRFVKAISRPYREEFAGYDALVAHIAKTRPDLLHYF